MQFKITGKIKQYKFWSKILQLAQEKVKQFEDKTINVISVSFPSAFCMLIRYEIINNGQKYEIVTQGDYQDMYKNWKELDEPKIPENINVEVLIKTLHNTSKLITVKKTLS